MIEGGWEFIWPAYGVALGALGVLTVVVVARLRAWERRARELDKKP
jgi:heme exporter protein CcmD